MKKCWVYFLLLLLPSCSLLQAVALKDCDYSYHNISDVRFMDMSTSELKSFSGIAAVTKALLGKTETVPLDFTVHLNVHNPNKTTAALERLYYIVSLDSVEIAAGSTDESLIVVQDATVDMPLKLQVDLKTALKGEQKQVLINAVKNFVGINTEPTEVLVQLRPIIRFGSGVINSPKYIPVRFTYTGKNGEEMLPD